ncbi:MAG: hypothetical protein JWM08_326, partial [Candidatus Angelobacter sp.]|nr:hypothetical protein [Candidatus Angelobacter sp.]
QPAGVSRNQGKFGIQTMAVIPKKPGTKY